MSLKPLRLVIEGVDRVTAPIRQVNRSIDGMLAPVRRLNHSMKGLGNELGFRKIGAATAGLRTAAVGVGDAFGRVAARGGLLGLAAGALGKRFLDTGAEFERFQTILETVEGSQEGARRAMAWVSEFATKTPFELAEVTDGFVRLKAYGIDPVNGTMRSVGDAAAAMGKPLEQAVEALADAVTGENERLKEFGIKARKSGGKIVYEYTQNGKQMRKVADANNRAQIEATLTGIWNDKYGGAMEKLSGTWGGMWSNLMDHFGRFQLMVMEAGVFDFLKGKLEALLKKLDAMAADGSLQKYAEEVASGFFKVVNGIEATVDALGGWGNVAKGVGALVGAWLIAPVLSLAASIATLAWAVGLFNVALWTSPITWIVAAVVVGVGLMVAAAYALWSNWDWISLELTALWEDLGKVWDSVVGALGRGWDRLVDFASSALAELRALVIGATDWMPDWLVKGLSYTPGVLGLAARGVQAARASAPSINLPPAAAQRAELDGRLQIDLKVNGASAQVSRIDSSVPDFDFEVDVGRGMTMVPGTP